MHYNAIRYLHRIGRLPYLTNRPDGCHACERKECPGSVCGEEADTPEHLLLRCPCVTGVRLRVLGNINIEPTQLQGGDAVAALAHGFWHHLRPLADGRR